MTFEAHSANGCGHSGAQSIYQQHESITHLALNVLATTWRMSVTASMPFHSFPVCSAAQQHTGY